MPARKVKPIGEMLVSSGIISQEDVTSALSAQKESTEKLGMILVSEGKTTYREIYKALSIQNGLQYVDLVREPPDQSLLSKDDRKYYVKMGFIPWKKDAKNIIIATTDLTPELETYLNKKYNKYSIVITSPYDINWTIQKYFSREYDYEARELLWQKNPKMSAKYLFGGGNSQFLFSAAGVLGFFVFFSRISLILFLTAINIFYWMSIICKSLFFLGGIIREWLDKIRKQDALVFDYSTMPIYTILVPMYREKSDTIEGIISAIRKLEYPKSKLDIKLIVEEDDKDTIEIIKSLKPENIFEIIKVPYSLPRTKPKACNYALNYTRGKYVTIYDAEDRPEPLQLLKAVSKFRESPPDIVCVQARLNYYNRKENFLTKMFSLEYSSWFNFMLPGLELFRIPIPLGGTSNHFPVKILKELYAWDPYNVTEDADLGLRIAQSGYRTAMIDSITLEESPVKLHNWINQRTRWIKGYMQTFIVHMRKSQTCKKLLGMVDLQDLYFLWARHLWFFFPCLLFY